MKTAYAADLRRILLWPLGGSLRGALIALVSLSFIAVTFWWLQSTMREARAPDTPAPKIAIDRLAQLVDHRGQPVEIGALSGRPIVAFFGYTHCPDICPMELATISGALERLGPRSARVSAFFVTLDPERDRPATLAAYLEAFHPALVGLTGPTDAIAEAANAFGVRYARFDFDDGGYAIDHTARQFVLDGEGRLVDALPFNGTPDALVAALEPLIEAGELADRH